MVQSPWYGLRRQDAYELIHWPAADALARLGSVALPAIYARMAEPCDELNVRLLAHIFSKIDGRELAICRLKIERKKTPKNLEITLEDGDLGTAIVRVFALLEDPEFDTGKYSPTKYYKEHVMK